MPLVDTHAAAPSECPESYVAAAASVRCLVSSSPGARCPPLLCTAGWPNTAVAFVLDAAEAAGLELVHADGDEAGAAIAGLVLKRSGARPWRTVDASAGLREKSLRDELLDDLGKGVVGQRRLAVERAAPAAPPYAASPSSSLSVTDTVYW